MKHLFLIFIFLLWTSLGAHSFAANYREVIILKSAVIEKNSQWNIHRAALLESHISNFSHNIHNIANKYWIREDSIIINTLTLTDQMRDAAQKIQTSNIEKSDADEIISSIVSDLSKLNTGIKIHLKQEIWDIQQYHSKHAEVGKKIAQELFSLTAQIDKKIPENTQISQKSKQVLIHNQRIKDLAHTLDNFDTLEFYKKAEIRASFLRIIKDIKKEIQLIRNL